MSDNTVTVHFGARWSTRYAWRNTFTGRLAARLYDWSIRQSVDRTLTINACDMTAEKLADHIAVEALISEVSGGS